jgi:hypothetical protein
VSGTPKVTVFSKGTERFKGTCHVLKTANDESAVHGGVVQRLEFVIVDCVIKILKISLCLLLFLFFLNFHFKF